ncbi:Metal tolerance protein 4 [Toxocara canis]|uniref:Metal tolerance protein 4 n=1 Tax=Toxocara canis TaxID=6265 RepID=A0A0B2VAF4_TOXCA|nr:Metal tolerance protein 4 [Toxocara canis]
MVFQSAEQKKLRSALLQKMEDNETQPLIDKNASQNSYAAHHTKARENDSACKDRLSWWERRKRKKGLVKYNEYQQQLLRLYMQDDKLFEFSCAKAFDENNAEAARRHRKDGLLASISFTLNIVLLFANATASFLSGSLSIISTFIDSAVDTTSGALIMLSAWAIKNTDMFNYPRGRTRLELVAVLMCSTIMGVANVMMIVQSVGSIINQTVDPDANIPTVALVVGGCVAKIILLTVCYRHGTPSSRVLALDQRNDILTSAVALCGAFIGDKYWLYADPIGAICVCTFIAFSWFRNAFINIPMMVGRRAQQENLSRIMRICVEHDSHIKCLDHVMVYHTGAEAIVEVHIVLDEQLPLRIAHDIIESLTKKLSALPFVERAFVHGDYRCDGDWQI